MATAKQAILKIKVNDVLQEILLAINADNIKVGDVTLTQKLASILTDTDTKISAAIDALIGGAPETYDTLKEISDYISTHADAAEAISAMATANKTALDALRTKVETLETSGHTHANKTVLDDITEEKIQAWDSKSRVYVSATEPADLKNGDLWFQVIE